MEMKSNNDQPESQAPAAPEAGEPQPQPKTWQDYATKVLYFLREWFLKAKTAYKIIAIVLVVAILVGLLLAYLGVFGQQVANLMKQLVNKIMELVGTKKS
ncbi:MAG: hypothetical protein MUC94_03330 [bacterium]|jgi:hypothetical protein|nr:hypothetical protein [bacterium]